MYMCTHVHVHIHHVHVHTYIYVLHVCEGQESLVASTVPTTSNLVVIVIVATG